MLRQLRAVLEVHPATAHRYFAAEHLVAIQHLITEGVPVPLARPEATVDMKGTELTSSQPGEFAGIRPGDKIKGSAGPEYTPALSGDPLCT